MPDSIFHLIAFLIVVAGIAFLVRQYNKKESDSPMICRRCATEGFPRSEVKGSIVIEIVLWLCFIIPGLIYSIWRFNSRHFVRTACGSPDVIPIGTPAAQKILKNSR